MDLDYLQSQLYDIFFCCILVGFICCHCPWALLSQRWKIPGLLLCCTCNELGESYHVRPIGHNIPVAAHLLDISFIGVLNKMRYTPIATDALCPMPYALCPMPTEAARAPHVTEKGYILQTMREPAPRRIRVNLPDIISSS